MTADKMILDPVHVGHAADLYSRAHAMLIENGWKQEKEQDPWWPEGKPLWSWRHPDYPGSWSMDAAFIAMAQRQLLRRV